MKWVKINQFQVMIPLVALQSMEMVSKEINSDFGFRISNNIKYDKECFVTVQKQMNNKYFILCDQ